jgi:hypothetical protein
VAKNKKTEESITQLLSLEQIAAWWLPKQMKETLDTDTVRAALPALQRGFVWKPDQIELLWDSIAQGFPIGALLLSEYPEGSSKPKATGAHSEAEIQNPNYFLLDGQQRATAIALGFRNIWANNDTEEKFRPTATLWVDMIPLENERRFAFRVLTKAHPWGYSRNSPNSRISASKTREALKAFRELNGKDEKPHKFSINEVFPWDAEAPIPVPLLIDAIREHRKDPGKSIAELVLSTLEGINFWTNTLASDNETPISRAKSILNNGSNEGGLTQLISGLNASLWDERVPAPVLTKHIQRQTDLQNPGGQDDEKTPIFNLFKRINTGGTALSREDINYSMLKSVWPEAQKVIEEDLLGKRKIAQPARMVSVMACLVLMAEIPRHKNEELQRDLSIADFSKHIENDKDTKEGLGEKIKSFCDNKDKGKYILDNVWAFLTEDTHALPTVLAFQISRQGGDLLLLLMYWIYCLTKDDIWDILPSDKKKQSLGFVTALDWFSIDLKRCVKMLACDLMRLDKKDLPDFFNHDRFNRILKPYQGRIAMTPLPHPDELKSAIEAPVITNTEFIREGNTYNTDLWTKKDLWHLYREDKGQNETIVKYFSDRLYPDEDNGGQEDKTADIWWHFIMRVCRNKNFILYAQRQYIDSEDWFGWFDPTQPDQITDYNRPWDYDHILPYSWTHHKSERTKQKIPYLVRIWVNVNGNLRAWPMELNRSKRDSEIIENAIPEYNLTNKDDVCEASFIRHKDEWDKLDKSRSTKQEFWKSGPHWPNLIEASMHRTLDLYKEWYDELCIGEITKND